ncbi:hypothetical protein BT96DRAFT_983953 [Gymnopus androsaceus JB14]|uniref:Class II aldolase/adducin N-terminal domain-containing protein n=1 Tax=Gymnopus androsaceus JB14 TaxID=1447944 RepID=A0A6A4IQ80_9AGAR|nr:hypothetical protein BT96DRAFT_983953 [Gymnopus androsaceus JB14]
MAAALRYWGKMGFGEGIAGHITVRDPVLPDHYWMNRLTSIFLQSPRANLLHCFTYSYTGYKQKSMLVLVGPDGYFSSEGAQSPINAAGFYIHSAIHKARPDVKAATHLGKTVDEAVYLFDALDRLCQVQLMVEAAAANENIPKTLISKEDAEYTANSINESRRNYLKVIVNFSAKNALDN